MKNTSRNAFISLFIIIIVLFLGRWWWQQYDKPNFTNKIQIGIIQVIEHPALDQTRKGIIQTINEKFSETDKEVEVFYESAQGNAALAMQIAQKFVGQKVDLIIAIGTIPAQAAAQATVGTSIPIIFASVTDPLGAKLVANLEKPEANITGVSNFVSIVQQFDLFKQILPNLKNLGIIYNPGEANSVILLDKMKNISEKYNLNLIISPAVKTSEVSTATQNLISKVQAIFINNDNTALAAFDAISKIGLEIKIPVFVSDGDCLEKGALAVLGPDQYNIGVQAGKMVTQILLTKIKVGQIPVQWPNKVDLKLNFDVAKKLNIQFPLTVINCAQ